MDHINVLQDHERVSAEALGDIEPDCTVAHGPLKLLGNEGAAGEHFGLPLDKLKGGSFGGGDG